MRAEYVKPTLESHLPTAFIIYQNVGVGAHPREDTSREDTPREDTPREDTPRAFLIGFGLVW